MIETFLNKNRLIETFTTLLRINSPSFEEKAIGELLTRKLEHAGCTVEIQEYGESFNLMAFKKGSQKGGAPLLLNAHMDTIEPTEGISFSVEPDLIKSTGNTVLGADDKSALAQILEALTIIEERKLPHGGLEIVFTSAEEKGLHGAAKLDLSMLRSKHGLVLDSGGSVGRIVIAAPTHHIYEMKVTGRSAHAGIEPERGINAIRVAAGIISQVPDGRIDAETTANIGTISGGTATNVVPREAVIRGELRSHSPAVLEHTKRTIFETARRVAGIHGAGITITEQEQYRAFRIDENDLFLQFLSGCFRKCGIEPVQTVTGGGSDANIFNERGIKAINISTGMQKVHSDEEFIEIQDLVNGSLVVLQAIIDFTGFTGPAGSGR